MGNQSISLQRLQQTLQVLFFLNISFKTNLLKFKVTVEIFIYTHVGQPKSVKIFFTFILYHIYINNKTILRKKNTLEFQLRTLPFLYHC